jgi:hypothetical protein
MVVTLLGQKSVASSVNVDPDSIASSTSFLLAGSTIKSFLDAFLSLRPIAVISFVCISSASGNLSSTMPATSPLM